jgi:quercetin dioxygenase-like cupin family protein
VTREALFGGVGAVKIWDLLGAQVAVPFSAVLYCELTAGGSVGQHRQERDHEFVLSLEGEADVTVGGRTQRLGPGQLVYLGQGDVLAIENSSTEQPFRYLIVKAQPSP